MNNVTVKIYPVNKEAEILMALYPPVLANNFLPEWYKNKKVIKEEI